jgi:anthranilate phosphoribosyltransferase
MLSAVGWSFCFGPYYHPQLRHIGPVRKQLRIMTSMNAVLPIIHPGAPSHRVVGVSDPRLLHAVAHALLRFGVERALIVAGPDGLDEFGARGINRYVEAFDGSVRDGELTADSLFGSRRLGTEGGDAAANASIARDTLAGKPSAVLDVVALNAGAALYTVGRSTSIVEGCSMARDFLLSGRAGDQLDRVAAHQRRLAERV